LTARVGVLDLDFHVRADAPAGVSPLVIVGSLNSDQLVMTSVNGSIIVQGAAPGALAGNPGLLCSAAWNVGPAQGAVATVFATGADRAAGIGALAAGPSVAPREVPGAATMPPEVAESLVPALLATNELQVASVDAVVRSLATDETLLGGESLEWLVQSHHNRKHSGELWDAALADI
jgi:hypothetical protein